jgi:hypothetical protein
MSATGDLGVVTSKNTYEKPGEKSATLYFSPWYLFPILTPKSPLPGHPHEAKGTTDGIDKNNSSLPPVVGWHGVLVLTLEKGDCHG